MRAIDTAAIRTLGIPRLLLMEHAGLAVARAVQRVLPIRSSPILVCCGLGYNGGDGLAAARHLHAWGYEPRILLAGSLQALREEPAVYARILQRLGLRIAECAPGALSALVDSWLTTCALMIDALLGIGGRGAVREPIASIIDRMNRAARPIIAADIPSGLDGDTGAVQGTAIRASVTVAFGRPKQGCLAPGARRYVGRLIVDPISLPHNLLGRAQ